MKRIIYLMISSLIFCYGISCHSIYAQQNQQKMSKKERIIVSQIPESILSTISTEELLDRCLDYPYMSDIFFAQNIPLIFPHIIREFNGLNEFFTNRQDAATVLLNKYRSFNVNGAEGKTTDSEKGLYAFKLCYLYLFLAQPEIVKQFKGAEKLILLELLNKHEEMVNYNKTHNEEVYDKIAMTFIGHTMAGLLNATRFNSFEFLINNNHEIKKLIEQFNIQTLSSESFLQLVDLTKDYIQ